MADPKNPLFQNLDYMDEESRQKEVALVKKILGLLDKTIGIMKIFSFVHENVRNFVDQTFDELSNYLENNLRLELKIEEFSFSYCGETVYSDTQIDKSLPYLFFKDGMFLLVIKRGITRPEFEEFLKVIHENAILDPEESDMVFSIWEKDFIHVDYQATDEFLASKIGIGITPLEYKVNPGSLFSGSVQLTAEDQKALPPSELAEKKSGPAAQRKELIEKLKEPFEDIAVTSDLTESEINRLEEMIDSFRKISPQDELLSLFIEMLYLDRDPERFSGILDDLAAALQDLVLRGNFEIAVRIMDSIRELKEAEIPKESQNMADIERFYEKLRDPKMLISAKKAFFLIDIFQYGDYFHFLAELGPSTVPIVVELYGENADEVLLLKIAEYLKKMAGQDPEAVKDVIDEKRPGLTKYAIAALGEARNPQAIQMLSTLARSVRDTIQKEAVLALGKCHDQAAANVLIGLLSHKKKAVRILAAQNLNYIPDDLIKMKIIKIIKGKSFRKKNDIIKWVLLEQLAQFQTAEAWDVFKGLIKKPGLFFRSRKIETSRIAAAVLKTTDSDEVRLILESGAKLKNKKIRKACLSALHREPE